jgi:hypothetical protein
MNVEILMQWPFLASVTPALFLGLIFGTYLFHRLSFEDEKAATFKQKQIAVQELDRVDSSQELRTKQEREEEQSLDGEEDREPAKTLIDADEIDDSVVERTIRQLNEYDERLHLVTFAATEQEADFILKYVNASRYLVNLDASDLADHVVTVEYKKRRSASCPPRPI